MSSSVVTLASILAIHPSIRVPEHCAVCAMWNDMQGNQILRPATYFGQWDDQNGPDNYIGVCDNCHFSGFGTIGTIEEFKACQLRAMGKAEYEVYGKGMHYECATRADACARIRKMIARGISINAVYQRSVTVGRLRKLNADDQARIVIEAMN